MSRRYLCEWFAPTYEPKTETHDEFFFNYRNGYGYLDHSAVAQLAVGETRRLVDHTITRVDEANEYQRPAYWERGGGDDKCPDCGRAVEYVDDAYRHVDPTAECFLYSQRGAS